MTKSPTISIIVPVYNVERYLQQCLEAIKDQTFKDWECILVDDGSIDKSGSICDQFEVMDKRFKVVHKENGGLSSARNLALEMVTGNFIAFVDSDDWPEPQYLETLYNLILKHDADVVQCGFKRVFLGYEREKSLVSSEIVLNKEETILSLLDSSRIPCFVWNKLFRREIITEKFPINQNYEDAYTVPFWLRNIRKMVLSPEIIYNYRMRKGSISNTSMAKNQYDYVVSSLYLADNVKETLPYKLDETSYIKYLLKVFIAGSKTIARREKDENMRHETIQRLSSDLKKRVDHIPSSLGLKKRFRVTVLLKNPLLFEKIMRAVNKMDFHANFRRHHLFE